jgi:murein DD-endopeptidase MepM/ murein hydrolase activator NlpD
MAAETARWGSRFFPEIRICFAARAPVLLPPWVQAAVLMGMIAGSAALAYLGVSRLGYERLAAAKGIAAARAETAKADLQGDLAGLDDKLSGLTRDRDRAQSRVAALAAQADALRGLLAATTTKLRALNQTRQALRQEQAESTALSARLSKIEADRAAEAAQFARYKESLEETAKELQELAASRSKGAVRRARFRLRLGELWQKLSAAGPQPGPQGAGAPQLQVTRLGSEEVATVERVLASTGIDVARLFSQFGQNPAEGGPFVPPPKIGEPIDTVDPAKLAAIRGLAQVLPLEAPLAHYQIGSPFGPRIDPFNHRAGFHTGIDMDAPYMSPVYATAPGTVVYAGYFGDYGKVVEINHGFGIETLYAHLHRCLVSVGQKVAAQAEIGLVGTTGRSTGPHVHYEVRVNGQPQDPEKFLDLSRLIPVAASQPASPPAPQPIPAAGETAGNGH